MPDHRDAGCRSWRVEPERGRTKKLVVAFQFQYANQAAWNCDLCRKNGLERKRGCRWVNEGQSGPVGVVWGRKGCVVRECPKSLISAESLTWLEEFQVWRLCPMEPLTQLEARKAEAFLILEAERLKELGNGE